MSVTEVVQTHQAITMCDLSVLFAHPDNPRSALGDLSDLAQSIREQGLIAPLVVVEAALGYYIVAGHRRAEAARLAGLTLVPTIIRDMSPAQQVETMLVENVQREGLTVFDQAKALNRLVEMGLSQRAIAERTGIVQSTVSKRLALLSLPTSVAARVDSGEITTSDAEALAGLARKPSAPGVLDRAVSLIVTAGRSGKDAVKVAADEAAASAKLASAVEGALKVGFRDVTGKVASTWEQVTSAKSAKDLHAGHVGFAVVNDSLRLYCTKPRAHKTAPVVVTEVGGKGAKSGLSEPVKSAAQDAADALRAATVARKAEVTAAEVERLALASAYVAGLDARSAGALLVWFGPLALGLSEHRMVFMPEGPAVQQRVVALLGITAGGGAYAEDVAHLLTGKPVQQARLAAACAVARLDGMLADRLAAYARPAYASKSVTVGQTAAEYAAMIGWTLPAWSSALAAVEVVEVVEVVEADGQAQDDDTAADE